MSDMLQEFCDSRGAAMRVDAQAGVIRGVKLLGLESRNGRTYLPETLAQAARLYEDAKVNVNHPKGNPAGPRDYQDRIGTIRGVAMRAGEGLFGDFHFNPKHALAEQLIWDAGHAPENVGFSHNVEARTSRRGDRVVVEAILRVQSVDLVADPATTRGLFESAGSAGGGEGDSPILAETKTGTVPAETAKRLSLDDLKRDYPELVESIGREQAAELGRLRQEVERLTASEVAGRKRGVAMRLLREFGLPCPDDVERDSPIFAKTNIGAVPVAEVVCSQRFFESLLAAGDEAAMHELVEERSRLVRALSGGRKSGGGASGPQSRDQHLVDGVGALDAKSFVEAIT
jgi:hypothetical protein